MKLCTLRRSLVVALALAACASAPIEVHEYVLASLAAEAGSREGGSDPSIGVGPVSLPGYLQRSEIVTRVGPNELRRSDTERWGEDLDRGLARVLAVNLSHQVPSTRVRGYPSQEAGPLDYRVHVAVWRFEGDASGAVSLEARWSVRRNGESVPFATREVSLGEQGASSASADSVDAMSRAALRLSEEIAAVIRSDAARALAP